MGRKLGGPFDDELIAGGYLQRFSILALSNFIPTIYFGLFTGLAMLLALISVLTLLPKMIMIVKPFGN